MGAFRAIGAGLESGTVVHIIGSCLLMLNDSPITFPSALVAVSVVRECGLSARREGQRTGWQMANCWDLRWPSGHFTHRGHQGSPSCPRIWRTEPHDNSTGVLGVNKSCFT
eukprot:142075-Amphidinium_carterae.1